MTKRETCEDKQDDPVVPSCQKNQEAAHFWRCKAGVNAFCCRIVTVYRARCGSLRLGMARGEIVGRESETERGRERKTSREVETEKREWDRERQRHTDRGRDRQKEKRREREREST